MIRALLIVALLAGIAGADPIAPPAGWTLDPRAAATPRQIGTTPGQGTFAAYRAPGGNAVLYATRVEAPIAAEHRDAVATRELAYLADAMQRAGAGLKTEASSQRADPVAKQLEAVVRWRDDRAGLVSRGRTLIAADATRIVIATAECMLNTDAEPAVAKACDDALATLAVDLAPAQRVPLAIVASAPAAEPEAGPQPTAVVPARLDDGSKATLPPIPVDTSRGEPDRRPMYVGGGLVVLAVVFYLNRRRRERFDEDEQAPATEPAAEPTASTGDDDADDLHAAARDPGEPKS